MALSDLAVFSEYTYEAMMEALSYNIELFNGASGGAMVLRADSLQGDFKDTAFWGRIDGLVRRRNAYGAGAVAEKSLEQLVDTMVKVAAGTPPVRIDPGQFNWIQHNPEEGGALFGQQLAVDAMADMVNVGIMVYIAAVAGHADAFKDVSGANTAYSSLLSGAALYGDRASEIRGWLMHSKSAFDIWGANLANTNGLFNFGTVNVLQDGFGRPFIVSDSPALATADATPKHYIAGMTPGAVTITTNGDFDQNVETKNGDENLVRTVQAEWSYNVGVKGYSWDKTSGGKSPNNAALATAANWDRIVSSVKDTAGVLLLAK